MISLITKYLSFILFLLLFGVFYSIWFYPNATIAFVFVSIFVSLTLAISFIFTKHKQAENPCPKIAKDILILIITLLLILFLGGLAGMFANHYASPRFGEVVGFVSAIAASFAVGYLVNRGMGKLTGN